MPPRWAYSVGRGSPSALMSGPVRKLPLPTVAHWAKEPLSQIYWSYFRACGPKVGPLDLARTGQGTGPRPNPKGEPHE